MSETFLEAANYTSISAPADVDEWILSGLTQRLSNPHTECEVVHWHDLDVEPGKPVPAASKSVTSKLVSSSVCWSIAYHPSYRMVELPRPVWNDVKDAPETKAALKRGAKTLGRK
ncbi:hypothetical protein L198_03228 [Cryptococcus wingfieldii CBS 7118]|uniref:Uncharacterized protein n=1 Tax=Cryptococcus wingfieldii CBS 7118 TaxID=1295528 RepID=A0A1E3JGZ4_9TREE|nr:hypothetical protein L198_03228 [Cryptococcus wingfieldii CBS 7118]ODN99386.1 hypothetical protein L198_03228 [Cryptococcus wingfieldii CBS 7118]